MWLSRLKHCACDGKVVGSSPALSRSLRNPPELPPSLLTSVYVCHGEQGRIGEKKIYPRGSIKNSGTLELRLNSFPKVSRVEVRVKFSHKK